MRVTINPKTGEFDTFRRWAVVENVMSPTKEITLEAARFENPDIQLGDYVEDQIESIAFESYCHAKAARQGHQHQNREAERSKIVDQFRAKEGQNRDRDCEEKQP